MDDNLSDYEDSSYDCPTLSAYYDFETDYGIVGCVIASFGILGNFISIVVLSQARLNSTTSFFLRCLAIYDTILLFLQVLIYAIPWIMDMCSFWDHILLAALFMVYPLSAVAHTGSIYMVVVLALERYLAVSKPFHAISKWTYNRARKISLIVLVWAFVYNAPRFFEYKPQLYHDGSWNRTWLNSHSTSLTTNSMYIMIYLGYISLVIEIIVPLIVLTVFHIQLLHLLRTRHKSILRINAVRQADRHTLTATIFAITFILFGCQSFVFAYNILHSTLWKSRCTLACFHVHHITILVIMLNSAVNFIFYCLLGRKFRLVLFELVLGRRTTMITMKSSEGNGHSLVSMGMST
ncbi:hypothetical protein LOTGIDRAFT_163454 [Lottia gigantea]|uniref:G-protein coupled receptors family 1 profile domain-containing protein n=1 Tax=Lottia gigantea TaxID=225164 RepID=V4A2N8_LOTGI|nr:hypothetical protein LOTGIDRAFT_163454 [Lottia gigantea]ESO90947.1 hypothetical protein LOTGIDRAFT_163454 [Lottia gigantea]